MEYRNIVVAVDFSANADTAFDAALELAKQYGSKLHIVHALSYPLFLVSPYQFDLPPDFLESARAEAKRKLQAAAEKAGSDGVEVEWHFEEGAADIAIIKIAAETGADLVVMGTRGNTGLKHIVLGSIAERTIRAAPCSVLTVKQP